MSIKSPESGPGDSLSAVLAKQGVLSGVEAVRVLSEVTAELARLHDQGRLHLAVGAEAVRFYVSKKQFRLRPPAAQPRTFGGPWSDPNFCPPQLRRSDPIDVPHEASDARRVLTAAGVDYDPQAIDFYQAGALLCVLVSGEPVERYLCSPRTKAKVPHNLRTVLDRLLGCAAAPPIRDTKELEAALHALRPQTSGESPARGTDPPPSQTIEGNPQPVPKPDTTPSALSSAGEGDTANAAGAVLPAEGGSVPQRVGPYELEQQIGRGGMGAVYRARDTTLGRTVAIKVLAWELARGEDFVRRFQAEASAAARVVHPNLIQIYSVGQEGDCHYFAMQYVDGESLAERIAQRGRLTVDETLTIALQALSGLAAIHRAGLVHRDVKPANVLLERTGRVLLADFGLVKSLQDSKLLTATGIVLGTVDYMSPEQGRGGSVDGRADLYSLGVLIYQLLSGQLPFHAESPTGMIFQHVYEPPTPLEQVAPHVPVALRAIVAKLLAKRPENRYETAEAVLADLAALRAGQPLPSGADRAEPAAETSTLQHAADAPPAARDTSVAGAWFERAAALWTTWWGRLSDGLRSFANRHTTQQDSQQEMDGAISQCSQRKAQMEVLCDEAESVLRDLQRQQEAWYQAAREAEQAAAVAGELPARQRAVQAKENANRLGQQLSERILEQQRQLKAVQLRLMAEATQLGRLHNQRDLLDARLKVAHARIRMAGGEQTASIPGFLHTRVAKLTAAAAFVIFLGLLLWTAQLGRNETSVSLPTETATLPTPSVDGPRPRSDAEDSQVAKVDSAAEAPSANSTEAPNADATEAPSANSTEAPSADATEAPSANSTEATSPSLAEAPTQDSTGAPSADSLSAQLKMPDDEPPRSIDPPASAQDIAEATVPDDSAGIAAPDANDDRMVVQLPARVDEVVMGASGRLLILHLKSLQQLAVFDVRQAEVIKYLPMRSDDISYAAGAEKLFVGLRGTGVIQRWDLKTFDRELTVAAPKGGIGSMAMGSEAITPLILLASPKAKRSYLIDPKTMEAEQLQWKGWEGGAWGPVNVHVSFDGSTAVAYGGGWAGIELVTILDGRITSSQTGGGPYTEVLVAGNGALIFPSHVNHPGRGEILRSNFTSFAGNIEGIPFPAASPVYSLAYTSQENRPVLTLFSNNDPNRIATIRNLSELGPSSPLPIHQRVHLIPREGVLVTVGEEGDRLTVRPFDLAQTLEEAELDYLFVESSPRRRAKRGTQYQYPIQVRSRKGDVSFALEVAPEGMVISHEGVLSWSVPSRYEGSKATVIVEVSDASGQTAFHAFELGIE